MVSLKKLTQSAANVNSIIQDVINALSDNELAEDLENNFSPLYSMILDLAETADCFISDIEK